MEQPIDSQQFNQPEQPQKSKKFIWISVTLAIVLVGVIVAGLYIWQIRSTEQNTQKTLGITTGSKNKQPTRTPISSAEQNTQRTPGIITETENEQPTQTPIHSAEQNTQGTPGITTGTENKQPTRTPISEDSKKILYKLGNDLVLYDPTTKEKSTILSSPGLIDFDLSNDQNFLAYSLKETGFEGNSDIYLKNLTSGQTIRLTEKNNISSFNPKIFPDNSKVAYVRRTYNPATKKLSDGEIWLINADGNIESSKKLYGFDSESFMKEADSEKTLDENGKWTGEYDCMSKEEVEGVKVGIESISPDGNVINYWQKEGTPDCAGLWEKPRLSKLDGSDFLTEKFKQQDTFYFDEKGWDQKVFNWEVMKIFLFADGSFVVGQAAPNPIPAGSIYYFDKDQNKKWELFDGSKQNAKKYDAGVPTTDIIEISDVIKKDDTHFIVAYNVYKEKENDTKYFVEVLNIGDKIDLANLNNKKYFTAEKSYNDNDEILGVKILNDSNIVYVKQNGKNDYSLYLYNFLNGKEEEIVKSSSVIDFDL